MFFLDAILNLAGLLIWLNWLLPRIEATPQGISLAGAIKRTDTGFLRAGKRWPHPAGLSGLLFVRAFVYWKLGPGLDWLPQLELGAIAPTFRSHQFESMLAFSMLGFLRALASLYLCLVFLSLVNQGLPQTEPLQRLVRLFLPRFETLSWPVRLLLPFVLISLLWLLLQPLLAHLGIVPVMKTWLVVLKQGFVIALGTILVWKNLVLVLLVFYLLNSYLYLGNHFFWNFINLTVRNILLPLRWLPLRAGKFDLAPLVMMALVWGLARLVALWLPEWYRMATS
jgi:hypothetical protein